MRYFLAIALVMLLGACSDEELKLPSDFYIDFQLDNTPLATTTYVNTNFQLTSGDLYISALAIEGYRTSGDNVFLEKTMDPARHVSLVNDTSSLTHLELPQGEYNQMKLKFLMDGSKEEPALLLKGELEQSSGHTVQLQFLVPIREWLTVNANEGNGNETIILNKKRASVCRITLDFTLFYLLFQNEAIDNAEQREINGVPTIMFSPDQNPELYVLLMDRLEKSLRANVYPM